MFGFMKREMHFLSENAAPIALSAFLFAVGGVLLWINGGSSWYIIRMTGNTSPQMSVIFSVWLITYSLIGAAAAMIWIINRRGRDCRKNALPLFCLAVISYLFMLTWYALFFCTRLVIFSAIILILSCISDVMLFIFMRRTMVLFSVIMVTVTAVQTYFLWFTFAVR